MHEDSAAYNVSTSSFTMEMKAVTQALDCLETDAATFHFLHSASVTEK